MYHTCCSTNAGDGHDNDSGLHVQECPGLCSACKQHLGFISKYGTWTNIGPSKLHSLMYISSTACKGM